MFVLYEISNTSLQNGPYTHGLLIISSREDKIVEAVSGVTPGRALIVPYLIVLGLIPNGAGTTV